jgi:hypothetical protein
MPTRHWQHHSEQGADLGDLTESAFPLGPGDGRHASPAGLANYEFLAKHLPAAMMAQCSFESPESPKYYHQDPGNSRVVRQKVAAEMPAA